MYVCLSLFESHFTLLALWREDVLQSAPGYGTSHRKQEKTAWKRYKTREVNGCENDAGKLSQCRDDEAVNI